MHVQCVPGSLESTAVNCMHRRYHMSRTLYLIKNTGTSIVPARPMMGLSQDHVFWLQGVLSHASLHTYIQTLIHVATGTWMWSGHTIVYSLMNKVLSCQSGSNLRWISSSDLSYRSAWCPRTARTGDRTGATDESVQTWQGECPDMARGHSKGVRQVGPRQPLLRC